jgi:hypothetical protein
MDPEKAFNHETCNGDEDYNKNSLALLNACKCDHTEESIRDILIKPCNINIQDNDGNTETNSMVLFPI